MAYLRIRARGKRRYYYIVESRRRGGTVRQKILQYLGHDPSQKAIACALEYWGIRKPQKAAAAKPQIKMLTVHPLGLTPVAELAGRVQSVPLTECPPCGTAVQHYRARCIGRRCGCETRSDLLAPHARGGRVYCVRCFTRQVDDYEAVQHGKAAGSLPKWVKRSPREARMGALWPEEPDDWQEWHAHGLHFIAMSGRVFPKLFTEPHAVDNGRLLAAFLHDEDDVPWTYRLAGYLLAGVGAEYLLKGLYLKAGYSLRNPDRPNEKTLAKLGTPEARWYDPRRSVSFRTMLRDDNLRLICPDPALYKSLGLAMWWRNEPGHTPMAGSADSGVYYVALGSALRMLHEALKKNADEAHALEIQNILTETKPIHFGATPGRG
jgi:hypothetical protein